MVELDGGGWVQINQPVTLLSGEEATYTFTNTLSRDYAVEKVWNPSGAATHEITLALYRTTDAEAVGSLDGEPVPADELDLSEGVLKVMLSGNSWTHTFQNLPRYNANSQLYYYYALGAGQQRRSHPRNGKITQNGTDYEVSYDWGEDGSKTTVTNTTATGLTGIKTWVDNGNVYGTRPTGLTLILERRVGTGNWDDVSARYTPAWDTTTYADQNQWTYTYTGLPSCDKDGNPYTIRCGRLFPPGIRSRAGPTAALQMSSPAP